MKKHLLGMIFLIFGCSPEGDMETSPTQERKNLFPPSISSLSPHDNATDVNETTEIEVVFSESMKTSSISTNNNDTSCSGTLQISSDNFTKCVQWEATPTPSVNNTTFRAKLSDNLSSETTYKIKITSDAKDLDDLSLTTDYLQSSGFKIRDWEPPDVSQFSPESGAISISQISPISIIFSEVMDNSSITINSDNSTCSGSVHLSSDNFTNCTRFADNKTTNDNITFIFYPYDNLTSEASYKIKVTTDVKDEDNNSMNSESILENAFKIVDWLKPTVISVTPNDGSVSVDNTSNITVVFSEVMLDSSITMATSGISCTDSVQVSSDNFSSCVIFNDNKSSIDNKTYVFDPVDNLSSNTTYKIKVTTNVKDDANNTLATDNVTPNGFTTN